ncbi:MAG TPA: carboxypeptidase-like regulatory domain-containing protein [Acidobacteriaceae bacterium]|nr:carboxypeptidase-like regulatory domain-containing protein [Acidobacteriaceae bacterium]
MPPRNLRNPFLALTALLVAVAVAVPVFAQDASSGLYSVGGTVVNSLTGQGIPHALVTLSADLATLTGGDGQFSFDNVPAGQYLVSVSKPEYLGIGNTGGGRGPRMMGGVFRGQDSPPRHLLVGADMPSVTYRLTPTATIVGVVSLSTSDPADGIRVLLYRQSFRSGRGQWSLAGNTRTRSDGSFRMGDLPPGRYMLATEASLDNPAAETGSRLAVWGYPPEYYPGVTDPGSAGIIAVGAGQQAEADMALVRQQFFPVTAAVRSSSSAMGANVEVLDRGGRQTGLPAHYNAREQVFHANVPNGTWELQGRAYGRTMSWGRTEIVMAGAPMSVAVNMAEVPQIPVNIERVVTSSTTTGYGGGGPGVNLMLLAVDGVGNTMGGGMSPAPGSNDTAWTLRLAEPGRFWVQASSYGAFYVSSITSGGVDLASNPLIVTPGSSLAPIDVTLRDDGGSIAGQIQSGSGSPANTLASGDTPVITVYAIPLFPSAEPMPQAAVQADGTFAMKNVAPGSYRVVACDYTPEIDYHTPEGLSAWTGKGQTVSVQAGGTAQAMLDVTHAGGSQ